jgi:uncharacterized protein YbaA (DUF1428 family)
MSYIDGFVVPVKTARKQEYIDQALKIAALYKELGATDVVECWGDDVPDGKVTDFKRSVDAKADETIVFSWVIWPTKAARDAGNKKLMEDPRMKPQGEPPFSLQRMIFGGFAPVVEKH